MAQIIIETPIYFGQNVKWYFSICAAEGSTRMLNETELDFIVSFFQYYTKYLYYLNSCF